MRDTQTDLQGVAPQNDNVHASHRSSAAVQRGDGKQERPRVPLESQSGIPARRSAAVGTNLNKKKKNNFQYDGPVHVQSVTLPSPHGSWARLQQTPMTT